MPDALDLKAVFDGDIRDLLHSNDDPRDRRNFVTGERIRSEATEMTCCDEDPLKIVLECEERDIAEGWEPGTALRLYLEQQRYEPTTY